eukprot:3100271-Alexandrium_andersonii.AAC.1
MHWSRLFKTQCLPGGTPHRQSDPRSGQGTAGLGMHPNGLGIGPRSPKRDLPMAETGARPVRNEGGGATLKQDRAPHTGPPTQGTGRRDARGSP